MDYKLTADDLAEARARVHIADDDIEGDVDRIDHPGLVADYSIKNLRDCEFDMRRQLKRLQQAECGVAESPSEQVAEEVEEEEEALSHDSADDGAAEDHAASNATDDNAAEDHAADDNTANTAAGNDDSVDDVSLEKLDATWLSVRIELRKKWVEERRRPINARKRALRVEHGDDVDEAEMKKIKDEWYAVDGDWTAAEPEIKAEWCAKKQRAAANKAVFMAKKRRADSNRIAREARKKQQAAKREAKKQQQTAKDNEREAKKKQAAAEREAKKQQVDPRQVKWRREYLMLKEEFRILRELRKQKADGYRDDWNERSKAKKAYLFGKRHAALIRTVQEQLDQRQDDPYMRRSRTGGDLGNNEYRINTARAELTVIDEKLKTATTDVKRKLLLIERMKKTALLVTLSSGEPEAVHKARQLGLIGEDGTITPEAIDNVKIYKAVHPEIQRIILRDPNYMRDAAKWADVPACWKDWFLEGKIPDELTRSTKKGWTDV